MFGNYLLKRKARRLYSQERSEKQFLNLKDVQTILVLFDTKDYDEADAFIEQLKEQGKNVFGMAYKNKNDEYDYSDTPYNIVTNKGASDLTDNKIESIGARLRETPLDLVVDLSISRNPVLEYLLASTHAKMRTGLKKGKLPQYDLAITALPKSKGVPALRELGQQIIYYLTTIQKKD